MMKKRAHRAIDRPRRLRTTAALLALSLLIQTPAAVWASHREYALKAAFLYNFTKFVEWPQEKLPPGNSPIVIGLLGGDPFGGELEKVVAERRVNDHPVVVEKVETPEQAARVHLLFLASGDREQVERSLAALAGRPVLTVGESADIARTNGIITLVVVDQKVRFSIDMDAADRAQLKISSQLQKLATIVRERS